MLTPDERLEFLRARQTGIGGSDVAAILGMDSYRTPMDVYLEKTRPITEEDVLTTNIHLFRGQLLEDAAADLYSEQTGRKVRRMPQREHKDFPMFRVNADRQILASEDRPTGALECKAPAFRGFQRAIEEGVRDEYVLQLQWALGVCGYDWGSMALCNLEHPAGPLFHFPVERNEILIEHMLERCGRFWFEHVAEHRPPDPSEWEQPPVQLEALAGEQVTITKPLIVDLFQQAAMAEKLNKKVAERRDEIRAKLAKWMRENEVKKALFPGYGKATLITKKGSRPLREKQLVASRPIDRDTLHRYAEDVDDEGLLTIIETGQLDLDFNLYRSQSDDYEYVMVYPQKERDNAE